MLLTFVQQCRRITWSFQLNHLTRKNEMPMSKEELVEAFQVLMHVIDTKIDSNEKVFSHPERGEFTALDVLEHAHHAIAELNRSAAEIAASGGDMAKSWEKIRDLMGGKSPVLQLAKAPGDRNVYLTIIDTWTYEDQVQFYAPTLEEVIDKAHAAQSGALKPKKAKK